MSKNTSNPQKLELTWIGKGDEPKLEPRILIENPGYSYGDLNSENMLVHGDNLLALKALEQDYAGKVKCVYIDPPYNTGNAFEQYDDGVEHSEWLKLISPRLKLLRNLLSNDGSIWISIDDDESHYLKVLCDEIFGRQNFVSNVIWEKKFSPQNDAKWLSDSHDHILVYAKNKEIWRPNLLPRTEEMDNRYKNTDDDPRGPWTSSDLTVKTYSPTTDYEIITPSGRKVTPPDSRSWSVNKEKFYSLVQDNRIWFGKEGDGVPRVKKFLSEVQSGIVSKTIWGFKEVGSNQDAKKEVKMFNIKSPFATAKPERLIEKILFLASKKSDLVLDSFLGSGTTAAVAHKMGRKWIGVELGEHAVTHCYPRLKQVVDGEEGGISKGVNWKGGGGFKFYTLAPSLLNQDRFGNWVINKEYNPDMLAAAMAKQEGFRYQPDPHAYWKQGISTEKDFIFTTTQYLTVEMLDRIQDEMQPDENLLICCRIFAPECSDRHPHISVKKIPSVLLGKCEFGKDDYSFNIINVPVEAEESEEMEEASNFDPIPSSKATNTKNQGTLFD